MRNSVLTKLREKVTLTQNVMVFVLWSLFAQTLFPTLAAAFPHKTSDGLYKTTLCTKNGAITITIDAQGNRVDDQPDEQMVERCPSCIFQQVAAGIIDAPVVAVLLPLIQQSDVLETTFDAAIPTAVPIDYWVRGPPSFPSV